jgi:hypothetical protein
MQRPQNGSTTLKIWLERAAHVTPAITPKTDKPMKKIPTIYKRNPENMRELLDEPHPDCAWVFAGEGVATRKYDGSCCKMENVRLWKRREVKKGKSTPDGFIEEGRDPNTGKRVGWVEVNPIDPGDRWHKEAVINALSNGNALPDGTYELVGPKVQGNPENQPGHYLISHADAERYPECPTGKEELIEWLRGRDIEGVVWHHPDGRMAKIKKKDFGLKR